MSARLKNDSPEQTSVTDFTLLALDPLVPRELIDGISRYIFELFESLNLRDRDTIKAVYPILEELAGKDIHYSPDKLVEILKDKTSPDELRQSVVDYIQGLFNRIDLADLRSIQRIYPALLKFARRPKQIQAPTKASVKGLGTHISWDQIDSFGQHNPSLTGDQLQPLFKAATGKDYIDEVTPEQFQFFLGKLTDLKWIDEILEPLFPADYKD